ncbi:uncharacterized protein LOC118514598 [Anopheles stephensi]|uniref:uncharacterized protein LOC118514598 n=1 Tax=Anopheles stephensi TaxID=30069 RepID=UPI001658A2E7|nr:uncharacterized protein LOC118514598 [Anopheles stephensi]
MASNKKSVSKSSQLQTQINQLNLSNLPSPPKTMDSDGDNIEATEPPSELLDRTKSPIYSALFKSNRQHPESLWSAFEVVEEKGADILHLDDSTISRQPFPCPAGRCRQPCCLFMFATHITFDHKEVLVDTVWPGEPTTVLIDPYTETAEQPRCHKLYLVSGKIRGLGDGKHRDKLPFVLMSAKFSLQGSNRLLLWITGPDAGGSHRQHYTMEAGRNDPNRLLPYAVAFSGEIVPLHNSQDAALIHHAGVGLVIPEQQIDSLTESRSKLLEVCVHFY